jgi:hypothetical protein
MARMLELVRASALPFQQMVSASKGALRVPAPEMIEILVHLADHNKIFGEQARLTLAAWDQEACKALAANPSTAPEVLHYWLRPANLRPQIFSVLIENQSLALSKLSDASLSLKGEFIDIMLSSPRVLNSPQLLAQLRQNHHLGGSQAARVQALIRGGDPPVAVVEIEEEPPITQSAAEDATLTLPFPLETLDSPKDAEAPETESALTAFFAQHATEIAADSDKPFQPIGGIPEELPGQAEPIPVAAAASAGANAATGSEMNVAKAPATSPTIRKRITNPEDERGNTLQKIAKLDVKGRIQLAMKGSKEERSILVRDGTKIVALAVLDSPKITDGEVEKFATQKNVLEAVLRTIPMKRRFAKNYVVVRNLVFNPRTPLDVSLGLMKNLLGSDLRHLSSNKEVSETIRKMALRMFKQKGAPANKG